MYGLVIGALATGIGPLVGNNAAARQLFVKLGGQTGLVNALLAAMMGFMGVAAAIYAVQAALRLRGEESGERAEPVLAAAVGRIRWAWSHLVFAVAGPVVLLLLVGLTTGLVYGAHTGDMGKALGQLLGSRAGAAAGRVGAGRGRRPAVRPGAAAGHRRPGGRWSAFLLLTELGSFLNLSRWATDISPFSARAEAAGRDVHRHAAALADRPSRWR